MINNINSYNSNYNFSSPTSTAIEEIIDAHKESKATAEEVVSSTNENLFLSSRAQKINVISREFFSGGAMNFNDVNALKERAYELGLISKQEYAQLTGSELPDEESALSAEVSSQSLASFSGNFVVRMGEAEVDDKATEEDNKKLLALMKALTDAKVILSDVDTAKNSADFKDTLTSTLASIKETINADTFETIPLDDKIGIKKVYQALEIVDKISHKRLSNATIFD